MASRKLNTASGRFDVQMAQCVVVNEIDKELLNFRVVSADTHYDFPAVGDPGGIYKANKEAKLYQWNEELLKYEPLNDSAFDVRIINGGTADGIRN